MIWAYVLLCALAILLPARLRYAGGGLFAASPIAWPPAAWWWLIGALAALAIIAAYRDRRRLRDPSARRALGELLATFPLLFAYEWATLPPLQDDWRTADRLVLAGLAASMFGAFWLDRRRARDWGLTLERFGPAARLLWLPTLIMMAVPLALTLLVGSAFSVRGVLISLTTYPIYAVFQLLAFQVFLVPRLGRLTDVRGPLIVASALMFALVHWPNGPVMLGCGLSAMVWTAVYLRVPNLYALALSMGLAATAFNVLPHHLTQHVRVGPYYVLRVREEAVSRFNAAIAARLASTNEYARRGGTDPAYIDSLYRDLLNRVPSPYERLGWCRRLRSWPRSAVVRMLLDSDELRLGLRDGPIVLAGLGSIRPPAPDPEMERSIEWRATRALASAPSGWIAGQSGSARR